MLNQKLLSIICFMAAAVTAFTSCEKPKTSAELIVGKWQSTKFVVTEPDGLQDTFAQATSYIYLNADKTFVLNLEGYENDEVTGEYSFNNNILILTIEDEGVEIKVLDLSETVLVLDWDYIFADGENENFTTTIYYQKIK
ncbi:MAG: lipocalin family protein [Prevotellaceae bacterium]|jgi:hypothetical protein|nr:lipocalin family protein [Prevotellaceae bacterium]